jgi:anti-repressor protein|nr:MAG TPA: antirepressor protein [Caudoviricetes sp.]
MRICLIQVLQRMNKETINESQFIRYKDKQISYCTYNGRIYISCKGLNSDVGISISEWKSKNMLQIKTYAAENGLKLREIMYFGQYLEIGIALMYFANNKELTECVKSQIGNLNSKNMNEIQVLQRTTLLGKELTVYGNAENPLFLAKDVAEWIEYDVSSLNKLVNTVDEDERLVGTLFRSGQNRQVWMLTESGLYEVLMQSRKPIAKQFKKGVKAILKEIRTKGGYMAVKSDDTPEEIMAKAILLANSTIERQKERISVLETEKNLVEEQNRLMAPKAAYFDNVLQSEGLITTNIIANELGMSAKKLYKILKDLGVLYNQNGVYMLYAKYRGLGYDKYRTHTYTSDTTGMQVAKQYLCWTQLGRKFILDLVNSKSAA